MTTILKQSALRLSLNRTLRWVAVSEVKRFTSEKRFNNAPYCSVKKLIFVSYS